MSASTSQKFGSDQLGGTFSYAQAAKGRSPSVPNTALNVEKPAAKRTASEGRAASMNDFKTSDDSGTSSSKELEASKTSPPSSPDYGSASTSTLPKEEDGCATQIDSSESTWDKQSQSSQNGIKEGDKAESGKRDSETTSWADDTPAPTALRDAPPPAVNFWEQRKELQAKAKATKPAIPSHPVRALDKSSGVVESTNNSKAAGSTSEAKKLDAQKRTKTNPSSTDGNNTQTGTKDWSKATDSKPKNGDDFLSKNPPKVSGAPESTKTSAPVTAPIPPTGDAISWPTPDSAQDEEKKRSQERADKVDKDKTIASKPSSKKEWTPMAFTPSAVFSTPIPQSRRGGSGRGGRGGRETGTARGVGGAQSSNGAEKASSSTQNGAAAQPSAASHERSRAEVNMVKAGPTGNKPKRSASAGPQTGREQRKASELASTERRKESEPRTSRPNANNAFVMAEPNGVSTSTQTENEGRVGFTTMSGGDIRPLNGKANREEIERVDQRSSDTHAHPRSNGAEKRHDVHGRAIDTSKDVSGNTSSRDRGEGQRGRGAGYRNRQNGGHGYNSPAYGGSQNYNNGHNAHHQPSVTVSNKTHSTHERHMSQMQGVPYMQSQNHPRTYRSSSRSHSVTHPGPSPYARFQNAPYPGTPGLAAIQTDIANAYGYQPGHQGIMTATPFTSSPDQNAYTVFGILSMQLEYYFSVDNLCKDLFLRKHMDSQGYVFLSVLVNFNRIKQLTRDIDLIKFVCLHSTNIEICTAADGIDRLRKKDGWEQWVLNINERDPSAQNAGPAQVEQPRIVQPPMFGTPFGYGGISEVAAPYESSNHVIVDDDPHDQPRTGSTPFVPAVAPSTINGNSSTAAVMQTPLSATVPEFLPNLPQSNGHLGLSTHNADSFTDEQVETLMIVVRKPVNPSTPLLPPFASAASRTFSNGSIDGRTMNEELLRLEERQQGSKINGAVAPELAELSISERSRSPFNNHSPIRGGLSNIPTVFWIKDEDTPINSLPGDVTHESYNVFRANGLQRREHSTSGTCHHDMVCLYQFWSHFLIRNFNNRMYQEFRYMAFDDAQRKGTNVGMKNLVQYYDESMLSKNVVIADHIARDYVDLVLGEQSSKERPGFDKLRAAWRNGATNMKNRKKIDNIIGPELKAQLER